MIDSSIYNLAGRGVKSVADYDKEYSTARQNKLAEMLSGAKMNEYQRGITDQNALRQTLQGFGADQGANQLSLLRGGHLKEAQDYAKSNADTQKSQADTQSKRLETSHKRLEVIGQGLGFLKDNPSMENAQRVIDGFVQSGIMDPQTAQEKMAAFQADPSPQGVQKLATIGYQGALSTKDQLPTYQTRNTGGTTDTLSINPVTGKVAVANSVQNTQSPESIASNAQSDLNSRRSTGASLANAGATREMARAQLGINNELKNIQLQKAQGEQQDRNNSKQGTISALGDSIDVLQKAIDHPGRETATGMSGTLDPRNYTPGTDAKNFQVVLDQIGGKAFLQAFQSLKGGGQITEVEGKKATDAIVRLNRSQSDTEFLAALKELKTVMDKGYERLAGGSYAKPATNPAQASPIDSLLDKYK